MADSGYIVVNGWIVDSATGRQIMRVGDTGANNASKTTFPSSPPPVSQAPQPSAMSQREPSPSVTKTVVAENGPDKGKGILGYQGNDSFIGGIAQEGEGTANQQPEAVAPSMMGDTGGQASKAQGAVGGAMAGLQAGMMTGNPYVAAGGAIIGGVMGAAGGGDKGPSREEKKFAKWQRKRVKEEAMLADAQRALGKEGVISLLSGILGTRTV